MNHDIVSAARISEVEIAQIADRRNRKSWIANNAPIEARFPSRLWLGCTVIVVDDGLATGSTMRAAVQSLRQMHPALWIVVAAPVAASETCRSLAREADEVVVSKYAGTIPRGERVVSGLFTDPRTKKFGRKLLKS